MVFFCINFLGRVSRWLWRNCWPLVSKLTSVRSDVILETGESEGPCFGCLITDQWPKWCIFIQLFLKSGNIAQQSDQCPKWCYFVWTDQGPVLWSEFCSADGSFRFFTSLKISRWPSKIRFIKPAPVAEVLSYCRGWYDDVVADSWFLTTGQQSFHKVLQTLKII